MDTLTHALVGIAVAGISGEPFSLSNPIYLASLIGAQAPDFDIIAQLGGNVTYLKQHRAFSHSVPGLCIWASLITGTFYLVMPGVSLLQVFFWAFAGGVSHILMDYFNAHGAAIIWPLSKSRISSHLLNVFDPLLLALLLMVFIQRWTPGETSIAVFVILSVYIYLRYHLRKRSAEWLKQQFSTDEIGRMLMMPSLTRIFFWDFVIETEQYYFVGQVGAMRPIINIHAHLIKQRVSSLTLEAQKTAVGEFFAAFTPFSYYVEQTTGESMEKQVCIYDLRYFFRSKFMHSAIVLFDQDELPYDSYIHTYGKIMKHPL
ncbi:metal-dependent hydrolase [Methylomusa anaerophila]|uniref:Inner membrane protein n=2 Tax=Methylomusa anaerophila TaxID=1930071 RepID=A0A348AF70_9FIRM|nr:metal-dependent hydrolase [Methylomusa anaerophila]BBB89718.1 hypothetical protein MAMMFC1_00351 [Methylomusa anaerophila]